jgi:hypothetical protein
MLDTRNYDRSITTLDWNTDYVTEISNDAGRTLMGSNQENWYAYRFAADSRRHIDFFQVLSSAHRIWRAWSYLASHWQSDRVLPCQHHNLVRYRGEPIQQRVWALIFML